MNTQTRHPEDVIYEVKKFIKELQQVQDTYFNNLADELNLNEEGEDYLLDYVYNEGFDEYDNFEHYLEDFKKRYKDMTNGGVEVISVIGNNLEASADYMFNSLEPYSLGLQGGFDEIKI